MPRHPGLSQWQQIVSTHLPDLTPPQVTVLVLWSIGIVLAQSCGLTTVAVLLAYVLDICATFADRDIVQRELIGALQHILARLGVPPQLVFTTRAGWEVKKRDAGNARIRPDAISGALSSA